jgi:hypothetical protein
MPYWTGLAWGSHREDGLVYGLYARQVAFSVGESKSRDGKSWGMRLIIWGNLSLCRVEKCMDAFHPK